MSLSLEFKGCVNCITPCKKRDVVIINVTSVSPVSQMVNSDRLAQFAGNVLLLSRLENQVIIPEKSQFLLDEQLGRAILMLEPEWNKKNINISINFTKVSYTSNEEMLMQVWLNLIGNAIKFINEGGNVDVSLYKEKDNYVIKISDSGIGMSKEVLKHIFDKFYQGDST